MASTIPATQESLQKRPWTGDWADWSLPLEAIYSAAEEWAKQLEGVEKPWLCWNMSPRWCVVQQNLARSVGWTPVVGFDPVVGPPPLQEGAILIDFSKPFGFDRMRPHFVLEWAFLFAPRLAFWHSDLLCRPAVMRNLADTFESLRDGEMAAVKEDQGWRYKFAFRTHRYWELAGCTTRGASRSQFEHGSGWWRHIALHPNCPPHERSSRSRYYYEFGVGIKYWKRKYGGVVKEIDPKLVEEGHCTCINNRSYKRVSPIKTSNYKYMEIDMNFDIEEVVEKLGIGDCLPKSGRKP